MNWRLWVGHWMLARSRRHAIKSIIWKKRAEKLFSGIKGMSQKLHGAGE